VLSNDKYFARLARLSGINPSSLPTGNNGGRHFNAVYRECLDALPDRVSQILDDCSAAYKSIEEAAESQNIERQKEIVRMDGKRAVYKLGTSASHVPAAGKESKLPPSERDPWNLSKKDVKNDW